MTPAIPDISIVIPSYNRHEQLAKTVTYLSGLNYSAYEIIIVDQSENETRALKQSIDNKIQLYKIKKKGLPIARNFGISKARGDIILFCDDDIIPTQQLITAHLGNYTNPQVGGVAGHIADKTKKENHIKIGRINRFTGCQSDNFHSPKKSFIDHGRGCNISFRTDVLKRIGGFDPRFGGTAFLEETDVCLRISRLGYRLIYEPRATVVHSKSDSGGCRPASPTHWFYWYGHNYMMLFWKNFNRVTLPFFVLFRLLNLLNGVIHTSNLKILYHGIQGMIDGTRCFFKGTKTDAIIVNYK